MAESPSTPHVYTLDCGLRIERLSSATTRAPPMTARQAKLTLGRDARRRILVEVQLLGPRPLLVSYPLSDCAIHTNHVASGKGSIEVKKKGVSLHLTNAAPRSINIFLKSLAAKVELLSAEGGQQTTPVHVARAMLMNGLPQVFHKLSPLTVAEMRRVRGLRGQPIPSPSRSSASSSKTTSSTHSATTPLAAVQRPALRPINSALSSFSTLPLSLEQRVILRAVLDCSQSVFFTGAAGTGKSVVLQSLLQRLPANSTQVTAATGVAACHLGGVTLHSFAGIGVGGSSLEGALRMLNSKKILVKRWRQLTHLIIDEISMIDADFFTLLEAVARAIRGRDEPFGGVQLIVTGDFLQLPPVCPPGQQPVFCFESEAWRRCIQRTLLLKEVRRQEGDNSFVQILQQIRIGRCDMLSERALRETAENDLTAGGVIPTRLCTHAADAAAINENSLMALETEQQVFNAEDSGGLLAGDLKGTVPTCIRVKIGAQVMLTKNLDLSRGLSNGARGVVTAFAASGYPLVTFRAMAEPLEIRPVRFSARVAGSEERRERSQLPLQLAWAISIHKSQGLTLDAVQVSLARVFAEGQAYVALSRARSLAALRILDFRPEAVTANPKVVAYYEQLQRAPCDADDDFFIAKRRRIS